MTDRIVIGVPHLASDVSWLVAESLLGLHTPGGFRFIRKGPGPVDQTRNQLVEHFLHSDGTHLLMVDSDAVLHPLTLSRLLSWRVPVVAALAFMRKGPKLPTVYKGVSPDDPDAFQTRIAEVQTYASQHPELVTSRPVVLEPRPDDALYEVDRTGCHCVLIERRVLAAIAPPWFEADKVLNTKEDFYFYQHVQAAGFPVYVDFSCMAAHLYTDQMLAALDHLVWDRVSQYDKAPAPQELKP